MGKYSRMTFTVNMPQNVNSATIGNNEVVFFIKKLNGVDEVVKYSTVPINGSILSNAGIHKIVVESKGDYVWVSN